MPRASFNFSVPNGFFNQASKVVKQKVGQKLRGNFADLRPLVQEALDNTMISFSNRLTPTDSEAGELGIGSNGSLDVRRKVAWIALQPSSHQGVTSFSVRKQGSSSNNIVGAVSISINVDKFYKSKDSVISTPDTNSSDYNPEGQIPWMKYLIEGSHVSDYHFVEQRAGSRTGRGIMVTRGFWDFKGRGREIYGKILTEAQRKIKRKLRSEEGVRILRK